MDHRTKEEGGNCFESLIVSFYSLDRGEPAVLKAKSDLNLRALTFKIDLQWEIWKISLVGSSGNSKKYFKINFWLRKWGKRLKIAGMLAFLLAHLQFYTVSCHSTALRGKLCALGGS